MKNAHPFQLIVLTICLLLIALGAFWLAYLPQRLTTNLQSRIQQEFGLKLSVNQSRLRFSNGSALVLATPFLAGRENAGSTLSAEQMILDTSPAAMILGKLDDTEITLQKPIIEFDVSDSGSSLALPATSIRIEDGTLKLRDRKLKSVIALTDINGTVSVADGGGLQFALTYPLGGDILDFKADVENVQRFLNEGSPTDFSIADKYGVTAFSGRGRFAKGLSLDGQLTVETQRLSPLMAKLSLPSAFLDSAKDVQVQSSFSSQGLSAQLKKLTGEIDAVQLSGDGSLEAGPDRTAIRGAFALDFRQSGVPSPGIASYLTRPWRERPLDWADFVRADADLMLSINNLKVGTETLGSGTMNYQSNSGQGTFRFMSASFAGGAATLSIDVSSATETPKLSSTLDIKSVSAKQIAAAFLGASSIDGVLNISSKLKSEGGSVASLISSLRGDVSVSSGLLSFAGLNLNALVSRPGEGWRPDFASTTKVANLAVTGKLQDGILELQNSSLVTPSISMKPTGEIDLLRQAFKINLSPKGKDVTSTMSLQGTWTAPLFLTSTKIAPPLRLPEKAGKADSPTTLPAD